MIVLKPGAGRKLPAHDEKQLEQLLIGEYRASVINAMWYSYPKNDNRLLIEYTISFYDNDEQTHFFRKARKKNGQWELSTDFRVIKYSIGDADGINVSDIIEEYMGV
ncbi:hypothetical protein [Pedobacter heparinus]|uniref:hypothetical protein n=1 Tax=Pedobacter heparinus TaxID=984 RepID=UPI00292DA506|nr:hypothetical protein [Pedobacter heparinus]